jgi:hypothetical protein
MRERGPRRTDDTCHNEPWPFKCYEPLLSKFKSIVSVMWVPDAECAPLQKPLNSKYPRLR